MSAMLAEMSFPACVWPFELELELELVPDLELAPE